MNHRRGRDSRQRYYARHNPKNCPVRGCYNDKDWFACKRHACGDCSEAWLNREPFRSFKTLLLCIQRLELVKPNRDILTIIQKLLVQKTYFVSYSVHVLDPLNLKTFCPHRRYDGKHIPKMCKCCSLRWDDSLMCHICYNNYYR